MLKLHWQGLPFALLGLFIYGLILSPIQSLPRPQEADVLRVVLPGYIEVLLAGGDRYVAANTGVFRAMMVGGRVKDQLTYEVQAKIQAQVAILNPRQEDNSYVAAAILPWWGQVAPAQFVLARATESRYWDYLPPFLQGFNEYYFNKNFLKAGELTELAASRASGVDRESLKDVAAKWYTLGDDPKSAIGMITALKEASFDENMKIRLQGRIDRLKALLVIRQAAYEYNQQVQLKPLTSLSQLVEQGYLEAIPVDPFQFGYDIDDSGEVQLRRGRKQ